jgi:DNA-binding transcriptional MerR regulator
MKYYKIGKVSEITGLSKDTLRYYEKNGLIRQLEKDDSGRKRYSERDIEWIEFLKRLKTTKMSVKDMARYAELRYAGEETSGERKEMLMGQYETIETEIEKLAETKHILAEKIKFYDETIKKMKRK